MSNQSPHHMPPSASGSSGPCPAGHGFGRLLLMLLCLSGLVMFLSELMLAFKAFSPMQGLNGSPWIGLAGFERLFANPAFHTMLINTAGFALLFALFTFVLGSLFGVVATRLPAVVGEGIALALTLPLFLPAEVFANWLFRTCGTSLFMDASIMRWLFPLLCALKTAGLPVLCACALKREGASPAGSPIRISALFAVVSIMLGAHTFPSLSKVLGTPLTHDAMNLADGFLFQQQYENMVSTPVTLLQLGFGLLATIVLYLPAKRLAGSLFGKSAGFGAQGLSNPSFPEARSVLAAGTVLQRLLSALLGLGLFTFAYFLPGWFNGITVIAPAGTDGRGDAAGQVFATFPTWLVQALAGAAIGTLLAFLVSRALVPAPGAPLRRGSVSMLLILGLVFSLPFPFSEYLFLRSLGLINTPWATVAASCVSISAIWAMTALRADAGGHGRGAATGPVLAGVFLMQSAVLWSDSLSSTLYQTVAQLSPWNAFRQLGTGMQALSDTAGRAGVHEWLGIAGFGIALPALLLFLGAYLLLPGRKLAAVLGAWGKR